MTQKRWPLVPTEALGLFSTYYEEDPKWFRSEWRDKDTLFDWCETWDRWWSGEGYGDLSHYDSGYDYNKVLTVGFASKSRNYILTAFKHLLGNGPEPERIMDWGAGVGLTTAMLALLWPKATVVYLNISERQEAMARWVFQQTGVSERIEYAKDVRYVPPVDMVCAFDLLEHLEKPIAELQLALTGANLYAHTSFSFSRATYYGHWREFEVGGETVPHTKMNRLVHKTLEGWGWEREYKGKFWNESTVYRRRES